jgi:hypothetical protein
LRLAYGAGQIRLELEYDPDKTDIKEVLALLLARASTPPAGPARSQMAYRQMTGRKCSST